MFQLTDIDFLTLADTGNRSDINIAFRFANNKHHYARLFKVFARSYNVVFSYAFSQNHIMHSFPCQSLLPYSTKLWRSKTLADQCP